MDVDHGTRVSATHNSSAQAVKKEKDLHILHFITIMQKRFIKNKKLMV